MYIEARLLHSRHQLLYKAYQLSRPSLLTWHVWSEMIRAAEPSVRLMVQQ